MLFLLFHYLLLRQQFVIKNQQKSRQLSVNQMAQAFGLGQREPRITRHNSMQHQLDKRLFPMFTRVNMVVLVMQQKQQLLFTPFHRHRR